MLFLKTYAVCYYYYLIYVYLSILTVYYLVYLMGEVSQKMMAFNGCK